MASAYKAIWTEQQDAVWHAAGTDTTPAFSGAAARLMTLQHMIRSLSPELAQVRLVFDTNPEILARLHYFRRGDNGMELTVGVGQQSADVMLATFVNPELAVLKPGIEHIFYHEKGHALDMRRSPSRPIMQNGTRSYYLSKVAGEFTAQQYAFSRVEAPADAFAAMLVISLLTHSNGAMGFADVSYVGNQQEAYRRQEAHFSKEFMLEADSRHGKQQRAIMCLLLPREKAAGSGATYDIYAEGGMFGNRALGTTTIKKDTLPSEIQGITQINSVLRKSVLEKTRGKAGLAADVFKRLPRYREASYGCIQSIS